MDQSITKRHLGGWWRLWIVLSALYVGIGLVAVDYEPAASFRRDVGPRTLEGFDVAEFEAQKRAALAEAELRCPFGNRALEPDGPPIVRLYNADEAPRADWSPSPMVVRCSTWSDWISEVSKRLLLTLIFPATLLGIGVSGRWIHRGFRATRKRV